VSHFSLRVRLASLIGLMLVVCGVALLAISYGLVSSNLSAPVTNSPTHANASSAPATSGGPGTPSKGGARPAGQKAATQTALRKRTLDQLVTQYLAVLAGVVLVAVAVGWLLAGRLLRSIRRITTVAERVTGRNLDERIGLGGPRDELRELADAFDEMLARLDAVIRAQRRFVADASHELRTPLTAMQAEVEVLAADPHVATVDVAAATLVFRRQLARSEELIEGLLALARSEPELLAVEDVDLGQIAREALEEAEPRAAARRLRVDPQLTPAIVHGDRRLLTLLVGNLIDNAIKHNHNEGWISCRTAVDDDSVLLAITSSGQLVTADDLQEITQAFRRGGRARVGDGHGLGLAIVQAVTRAHHGTMTIKPGSAGGLNIEVRLPLGSNQATGTFATRDASDAVSTAVTVGDHSN
jgi:signal transduction histidine kinase